MDMRFDSSAWRTYQDFQPASEWLREDDFNTLKLNLTGFRTEQLKVQIDTKGNLKVSGERPLDGNKFSRFQKEFRVPRNCNINGIHAKFENGLLSIILPKQTTKASKRDQPTPTTQESPPGAPKSQESLPGPKTDPTPSQESPARPRKKKGEESEAPESDTHRRITEEESKTKRNSDKSPEAKHEMMAMGESWKEEQKVESMDAVAAASTATATATGKMTKWSSFKNVTSLEIYRHGMDSLVVGIKKHRRLMVNMLVATTAIAALGIYLTYKLNISLNLKKSTKLNPFY